MFISFNLEMKELNRDRNITVYLPDNYYKTKKKYPVLYIQDGQNAFFDRDSFMGISWGFLEYVKETKLDIIMVAVPCNFEGMKRMDEYGPWKISKKLAYQETQVKGMALGGEGRKYVKWLVKELKPYIDHRFRTKRKDTGIVGSSMGGVISAYASLAYPHVFNKCAALSTAFWFYPKQFRSLIERKNLSKLDKFYFDLGEFEGCGSDMIDEWYVQSNDEIYELLKDRLSSIEYHYFAGAYHNEMEWRKRVPIFMEYFYKG